MVCRHEENHYGEELAEDDSDVEAPESDTEWPENVGWNVFYPFFHVCACAKTCSCLLCAFVTVRLFVEKEIPAAL